MRGPIRLLAVLAALAAVHTALAEDAAPDVATEEAEIASEEAPPEVPASVRAAERLLAQLEAVDAEIADLDAQVRRAKGEDRLVLEKQNVDAKLEFLELTGRLVDNVLKQEQEGLDPGVLRKDLEQKVIELTPAIKRHIDQVESLLAKLRGQRDAAPPEELLAFEQKLDREISWLDSILRGYAHNVEHRERLGLPSEKARKDLQNRLSERAELEAGRIKLVTQMVSDLRARSGKDPDDPGLQKELAALNSRRETVTTSLDKLVRLMDTMGLDATKYQQLLITSTGEVSADIFKPKVALGLLQDWIDSIRSWARENGPAAFFKVLVFLSIITLARIASKLTRRILGRTLDSSRVHVSQLLERMTVSVASNAVMAVGVLIALSQLGLELGPLLAGLGIAGFILGFALQDSLSNFAAGMMILGYRPFDVGDIIEAATVRGKVSHMSLVNTTILTFDNRTLIVPNNKIWGDVIANLTLQDRRRVDMKFSVAFSEDVEHAERTLQAILNDDARVLDDPKPLVKLHELGERGCEFVVRPWVATGDYWDVYWDITREVKRRFDAEGIRIPYPRRDVYVHAVDDSGTAPR